MFFCLCILCRCRYYRCRIVVKSLSLSCCCRCRAVVVSSLTCRCRVVVVVPLSRHFRVVVVVSLSCRVAFIHACVVFILSKYVVDSFLHFTWCNMNDIVWQLLQNLTTIFYGFWLNDDRLDTYITLLLLTTIYLNIGLYCSLSSAQPCRVLISLQKRNLVTKSSLYVVCKTVD